MLGTEVRKALPRDATENAGEWGNRCSEGVQERLAFTSPPKVKATEEALSESGSGCAEDLQERLVFTSPPKDKATEEASTEGCNI